MGTSTDTPKKDVIDKEWLERMASTRKDFVKRMFSVFIAEEPKRLEKVKTALEINDFAELKFLAHSIKGAASTLGAEPTRAAAAALEIAARDENSAESQNCYSLLDENLTSLVNFMQNFIDKE
ncbi:MAG: Hpt domain-containing protein [Desulfovibrio sp.]|uniref:Hpt domain-containing protein n=1 Tax=Desulfovibrio sp. 7SRBS1 TaxID=3378064 RepID=UPI003B4212D9